MWRCYSPSHRGALAGGVDKKEPGTTSNHDGAGYAKLGAIVGGIVSFCVGGTLGAAAGAASGYEYGEASDAEREKITRAPRRKNLPAKFFYSPHAKFNFK